MEGMEFAIMFDLSVVSNTGANTCRGLQTSCFPNQVPTAPAPRPFPLLLDFSVRLRSQIFP